MPKDFIRIFFRAHLPLLHSSSRPGASPHRRAVFRARRFSGCGSALYRNPEAKGHFPQEKDHWHDLQRTTSESKPLGVVMRRVVLVVGVFVMVPGCGKRGCGKDQQQQNGGKNPFHGKTLACRGATPRAPHSSLNQGWNRCVCRVRAC
jgi:hypothetical protein